MSIRLEASAFQPVPLRTQIVKRKSCQRTSCTVYATALDLRRWRWILWNLGLNDWTGGGGGVALRHMFSWIFLFDKTVRDPKRFDHGSCADIQWHTHELAIQQVSSGLQLIFLPCNCSSASLSGRWPRKVASLWNLRVPSVRPVNGTGTGKVKGWSSRGGIETRCRVPKWQMPAFFVFLGEMPCLRRWGDRSWESRMLGINGSVWKASFLYISISFDFLFWCWTTPY